MEGMQGIVIVGDRLLTVLLAAGGYVTIIGGVATALKYVSKGDTHGAIRCVLGFAGAYGCIRFLPWIVKMIDTVFATM